MSLSKTISYVDYTSTGGTEYPIPFSFPAVEHIHVYTIDSSGDETELTQGVDYTITTEGALDGEEPEGPGDTVTLTTAVASGTKVRIRRILPYTQPAEFRDQGPLSAAAIEALGDWLEMQIQQLKDGVGQVSVFTHGDLPGGSLHAVATADANGFQSKEHYSKVEAIPDDIAPKVHTHIITDVTGLQTALDGKSDTDHTHTTGSITGLSAALAAKAAASHTQDWVTITNTPTTRAGYGITDAADKDTLTNHLADTANPHGVTAAQVGAAATGHTHNVDDVSNLQTILDSKALASDLETTNTTVAGKADADSVVDLSTDQLVSGKKTFGDPLSALGSIHWPDSSLTDYNVLFQSAGHFLTLRNYVDPYTVLSVRAGSGDPDPSVHESEATLSLVRTDDADNEEFIDIYNNGYTDSHQAGIRIQKRGTGEYIPFVLDWYDGTTWDTGLTVKQDTGFDFAKPVSLPDTTKLDGTLLTTLLAAKADASEVALKAPITSPVFQGTPIMPVSMKLGTWVLKTEVDSKAPIDSPIFTGTPTLPTTTKLGTAVLQTTLDGKASTTDLNMHVADKANPHAVTAAQVGATSAADVTAALPVRAWGYYTFNGTEYALQDDLDLDSVLPSSAPPSSVGVVPIGFKNALPTSRFILSVSCQRSPEGHAVVANVENSDATEVVIYFTDLTTGAATNPTTFTIVLLYAA